MNPVRWLDTRWWNRIIALRINRNGSVLNWKKREHFSYLSDVQWSLKPTPERYLFCRWCPAIFAGAIGDNGRFIKVGIVSRLLGYKFCANCSWDEYILSISPAVANPKSQAGYAQMDSLISNFANYPSWWRRSWSEARDGDQYWWLGKNNLRPMLLNKVAFPGVKRSDEKISVNRAWNESKKPADDEELIADGSPFPSGAIAYLLCLASLLGLAICWLCFLIPILLTHEADTVRRIASRCVVALVGVVICMFALVKSLDSIFRTR